MSLRNFSFALISILLIFYSARCEEPDSDHCDKNNPQDEEISKEFTHMAMLGYDIGSRIVYGCHGILIDESYVLTTAACSRMETVGQPTIARLGISCPHFQYRNISEITVHPEVDPDSPTNDARSVALIKLEIPAENTEYVTPTKLYKTKVFDKQQPIEAAWVNSKVNDETFLIVEKYHTVVLPYEQCSQNYRNRNPSIVVNKQTEVCAYPVEESKDSLGVIHLMKNGKLQPVGIMAGGAGVPPDETYPNIYIRISSYINWIRENMKK